MFQICPIKANSKDTFCVRKGCAWWADGMCAITAIAISQQNKVKTLDFSVNGTQKK
jgi:hypothetical protein